MMNVPIQEFAPVKATRQIEVYAPVEKAWQVLTDIQSWPAWQKAVTQAVVHGETVEGVAFDWKAGGLAFKSKIHTMQPPTHFGWTGTTMGASAIHNWTFEKDGDKTLVKVEESLQGVLPRLLRGYFQKNLDAGMTVSLNELKAAAESIRS